MAFVLNQATRPSGSVTPDAVLEEHLGPKVRLSCLPLYERPCFDRVYQNELKLCLASYLRRQDASEGHLRRQQDDGVASWLPPTRPGHWARPNRESVSDFATRPERSFEREQQPGHLQRRAPCDVDQGETGRARSASIDLDQHAARHLPLRAPAPAEAAQAEPRAAQEQVQRQAGILPGRPDTDLLQHPRQDAETAIDVPAVKHCSAARRLPSSCSSMVAPSHAVM